jgi:hypothetical protein
MPHPVDDLRLWPNIMADRLNAEAEVYGDFGWTARNGWYALGHDPRLWAVLPKVDAVILALGQFDTTPAPLPNVLWKLIPLIRSTRIRRVVGALHLRAIPVLTKLFVHLPGGGPVSLPPRLTAKYLQESLTLIRRRRPGAPVVSMTPIVGKAKLYAYLHPGREAAERAMRQWAAASRVPLLDLPSVVGDHMLSGRGNPDGMHLGWEGHLALGTAMAEMLTPLLAGTAAPRAASAPPLEESSAGS